MSDPVILAACREAASLLARGDHAGAAATIAHHLTRSPHDPNLLYVAGNCALAVGDRDRAEGCYRRAIHAAPTFPAPLLNLGFLLRLDHRVAEARSVLRRCVTLAPGDCHAWTNLTACYVNEGEPEPGEAVAREALRHCPTTAEIHWNLGLVLLEQGRWREGWREYSQRFASAVLTPPRYSPAGIVPPRPTGPDDLSPGDTVVCHGEQGLGDEILFAGMLGEFIATVRARGAVPVIDCHPRLRSVMAASFAAELLTPADPAANPAVHRAACERRIDWLVPIGDLGGWFRNDDAAFPDRRGYLVADSEQTLALRRRLTANAPDRPLVGIAWSGGRARTHAAFRRIPLVEWLPLLRQPACFVSLQYEDDSAERQALAREHGIDVVDAATVTRQADYGATFALVAALDLVVSVPTSVVHVAGAVGTPCWVAMDARAAWRECGVTDAMPWYPRTHRRFVRGRDTTAWGPTIAAIATAFAAAPPSVHPPANATGPFVDPLSGAK